MPKQLAISFRHIAARAHEDWREMKFSQLLHRAGPSAAFIIAGTHNQSKIRQRINLFVPLHCVADIKSSFGIES